MAFKLGKFLKGVGKVGLGGLAGFLSGGPLGAVVGAGGAAVGELNRSSQAKKAEAAQGAQNSLIQRQMQLGEQDYASKAPMRQAGLGALKAFYGSGARGIFNAPRRAGDTSGQDLQPSPWTGVMG